MANPNWVKGGPSPNPAGRPPRAREAAVLAILQEIVGGQEWRAVFRQALLDALGMVQETDAAGKPRLARDPESTAGGRTQAMKVLLSYAVGVPTAHIRINDEGDTFEQFRNLSEEQIVAILAELDRVQSTLGATGSSGAGVGETPAA